MIPKDHICKNIIVHLIVVHEQTTLFFYAANMKAAALVQHHGNPSVESCSAFSIRGSRRSDSEGTIKDIPSIISRLRVLNVNAAWGLCKKCTVRASHRLIDGSEMIAALWGGRLHRAVVYTFPWLTKALWFDPLRIHKRLVSGRASSVSICLIKYVELTAGVASCEEGSSQE